MKVKFKIKERLVSLRLLNQNKGLKIEDINRVSADAEKLQVTKEEWKEVDRKDYINGEEITDKNRIALTKKYAEKIAKNEINQATQWSDEKDKEKEIELTEPTINLLKGAIKEKEDKGELGIDSDSVSISKINEQIKG